MKARFFLLLTLVLVALSPFPADAGISDWSVSEGGRMRIAALEEGAGKVTAVLEIEPEIGWKTYWRHPGDAGMPPQIDLSGAENLRLVSVRYPAPETGRDEGGLFIGYHRPVSLVLELAKPDPVARAVLKANVMVGLCKEICLPFQSAFNLPLDGRQTSPDAFMKVQMAKAVLPEEPSQAFSVVRSGLSEDRSRFEVEVRLPEAGQPEVAAAPSAGLQIGKESLSMREAGILSLSFPVRKLPKDPARASLTLVVKAGERAMETTLPVE